MGSAHRCALLRWHASQPSTKETIVADDSKTPRSDRAAAAADPAKPQDLPPKDVDAPAADRVKGGVKKTLQTQ